MGSEKRSVTLDIIVSEVFKWIGFAWTGLGVFFTLQFFEAIAEGDKITNLEYNMRMYQLALEWAIVAIPAFVASYFGKK
ncbi:MAG TPA: hypothetical protein PK590_02290 [Candidatus Omnitrophota bacterium]|jgi:hypothetical protein|nr:hypothetical protein [Candidatus Omnitrophota bacterium]HPW77084.1 hypothetical protein [Candidatus Omnitrophota bacterium]